MSDWEETFSDGKLLLGYRSITSTQDEASRLIHMGQKELGAVQADFQIAGRGRRGSTWLSDEKDSLLITYILSGSLCKPDTARFLAFIAGAAVSNGVFSFTGKRPLLKWPNDIFITGKKIGGILIETITTPDGEPAGLIGVGLNLFQIKFPQALTPNTTSILHEWNIKVEITSLREAIYQELQRIYELYISEGLTAILKFWKEQDGTTGTTYQAVSSDGLVIGAAEGIDETGKLLLRTEDGSLIATESDTSFKQFS
jgi:BirA family biotin operon repressor/biotin-[acetyl-CoA-carboxylase] ligase